MQPKLINVSTDADIADALGKLRADAKALQDQAKVLEGLLKSKGVTEVDGAEYRVTIAYGVETKRVDWKAVAAKLNPSRQLVAAHSKVSKADRVRVSAHKKG